MLLIEEIDNHYLLSLGFSNARISDPEQTLKQLRSINNQTEVQLVKADLIGGPEHLQFAARNALYSFKGKRRRSKSLAMEAARFEGEIDSSVLKRLIVERSALLDVQD